MPNRNKSRISSQTDKKTLKNRKISHKKIDIRIYLSEINVEEEGFLGVGDLNPVLLVRIGDVHVIHSLCNLFHRRRK